MEKARGQRAQSLGLSTEGLRRLGLGFRVLHKFFFPGLVLRVFLLCKTERSSRVEGNGFVLNGVDRSAAANELKFGDDRWRFPKIRGALFGVSVIRIIGFGGLYRGRLT